MYQRKVRDWIAGFLEYTDNTEPRESYRKWVAISTIASVLQRKCFIAWGRETFYPNLYIILVGPPAARKGTAMKEGRYLLNKIGLKVAADETSRQKLVTWMKNSRSQEQTPDGKPYFHCSITVLSTELTVFLGYEAKEMLSVLCKFFDCEERFLYDTHSRDEEEITNVFCNLLGATTPAQLQASLPQGAIGSGFTSRVVFVYEEDKARIVVKPELSTDQIKLRAALISDLGEIRNICGQFVPTKEFEDIYTGWRESSESKLSFSDPRLDYYIQRRPTHLFKLCTILSAARSSERMVEAQDILQAIDILESTERKMPRVFEGVGANPLAGAQVHILNIVERAGKMSISDIADSTSNDLTYSQLSEVLSHLHQTGRVAVDLARGLVTHKKGRRR
jgi:hypothetical protein